MTTLFILGAGFSRPAGGPLLREMLDETNEQNKAIVGEFWETAEWQVIRRLVSTLPQDEQNVEGVFNALSSRAFLGKNVGRYAARTLMDRLVGYVAALVGGRVRSPRGMEVYDHFLRDVLGNDESAIISFNYDFVLEELLMEGYGGLDYGFPATSRYRYYRLRNARKGPYLFKLHGSINWVICGVCRTIWLHDRLALGRRGAPCPRSSCQGKLRLLIIPPMWNKEPVAKDIELLWREASALFPQSEEVLIIGFSFPHADRLALDLIRNGLSANPDARVYVHNGDRYDYAGLSKRLGREFTSTGGRLEDL